MSKLSVARVEKLAAANSLLPFEQREMVIGFNDEQVEVYIKPASALVGGPPNSGKSVLGAWWCAWITHMDGRILLIDPHCNSTTRGLTIKVRPLTDWFVREPVDFTDKTLVLDQFEWLDNELLRREQPGGITPSTKMVWLVVDELTEFLSRLSREEKNRVATIVGNISRAGAKFGCFVLFLAHQWQLSKSGGGDVRSNVMLRISVGGEVRQMAITLDVENERVKELWKTPIAKGDMLVRLPDYQLRRLHVTNVTARGCENAAQITKRAIGSPSRYSTTVDDLVENMQNTQYTLPRASTSTSTSTRETAENNIFTSTFTRECLDTSIEPFDRRDGVFPLTNSLTSALPPEPLHFPTLVHAPRANNISEEDRLLIIQAGNQQLEKTGKVIRTKILSDLRESTGDSRWNNKTLWKVTAICDEMNWNARMQAKKELSTQEKQALRQAAGKCAMCGSTEPLEVDHRWPKSLGGTLEPENIQVLCKRCNARKSASV